MSALRGVGSALLASFLLLAPPGCTQPPADSGQQNKSLVLAHPLPPLSHLRTSVVVPFMERLAERSGGRLTATEYMGGALGSATRMYYSMVLDGVADIVLAFPGYTAATLPRTALIAYPGVCDSGVECTAALHRALPVLEDEYGARILALWSGPPPILLTRDRPVRRLEDFEGLKIRVSSHLEVPFVEALGASAVMQPVSDLQQSLHTGVIDGVVTTPPGVLPFQLQEAASYLTTWMPLSALPVALLMNLETYESLSARERSWLDAASDPSLSHSGARIYQRAGEESLRIIRDAGIELIDLSDEEKARIEEAVSGVYQRSSRGGSAT